MRIKILQGIIVSAIQIIKKNIAEFEDIAAYQVHDGCLFNLMRENNHIVDTRSLSDPIARIYEEYNLQK